VDREARRIEGGQVIAVEVAVAAYDAIPEEISQRMSDPLPEGADVDGEDRPLPPGACTPDGPADPPPCGKVCAFCPIPESV